MDVTCAILITGTKVLLAKRGSGHIRGGLWEFPGGKLQNGETLEDCIIREIREELGVDIEVVNRCQTVGFSYPDRTINLHPFYCSIIKGKPVALVHEKIEWVEISRLDYMDLCAADKLIASRVINQYNR